MDINFWNPKSVFPGVDIIYDAYVCHDYSGGVVIFSKNSKTMLIFGRFENCVLSAYSTNVSNSPKIDSMILEKRFLWILEFFLEFGHFGEDGNSERVRKGCYQNSIKMLNEHKNRI